VHAGEHEEDGTPLLRHIARVAVRTPAEARAVAWLHEALESAGVSEHELLAYGVDDEELRALRLLSRPTHSRSVRVYLAHVELIACAAGRSGHLARMVKLADLEDRRLHPRVRADGWSPPYESALRLLGEAHSPYEHV
jgi:D-serine deaminase-like pyridoxal phosphate-dependent protein